MLVMLDPSAAFDTVDHSILLPHLEHNVVRTKVLLFAGIDLISQIIKKKFPAEESASKGSSLLYLLSPL